MADYFIPKIFNKEPEEIILQDVKNFFLTPQEETSILEFKSGQVEIDDIYKEVAAFLNTEGGLLIVGTPRESKKTVGKNTVTYCQGELIYSNFSNKDWLYQKIATNVIPSPTTIKIKQFQIPEGSIYLIDVAQSPTPPHQVNKDGRYYIRLETEAKHAPHGLVQALFERRKKPILNARIDIKSLNGNSKRLICVTVINESPTPADKVSLIIDVYNVHNVDSYNNEFNYSNSDQLLGPRFSFVYHSDKVLVRVISMPITFSVLPKNNKFLVCTSFWSKDSDYNAIYWTYDPMKKEIVNEGYYDDPNLDLLQAIKMLSKPE